MKNLSIAVLFLMMLFLAYLTVWGQTAQTNDESAEQAFKFANDGKNAEALQICQKILQTNPTHPVANYACGMASFNLQKFTEAEKYLKTAQKTYIDEAEIHAALGRISYLKIAAKPTFAQYSDAMQNCQKALRRDRYLENSQKCNNDNNSDYAKFLQSNSKNKQSVYESFKKAIAANPKDTVTISIFFDLLAHLNDYKQITATISLLVKNPVTNWDSFMKACDGVIAVRKNTDDNLGGIPALRVCADSWKNFHPTPLKSENSYRFEIFAAYQRQAYEQNYNLSENADYLNDLTAVINDPTAKYTNVAARFKRLDLYIYRKDYVKAEEDIKVLEKTPDVGKSGINFRKGKIYAFRDKNIPLALRNMEASLQDCELGEVACSDDYYEAVLFYLTNSDYKFSRDKLLEFQKKLKMQIELLDDSIDPQKVSHIEREPFKSLKIQLEKALAETPK